MLAVDVDDRHSSVSHRDQPIENTESPFLIPQELRVAKTGIDEVDDDLVTGQLTKGMNVQNVDGYGCDDVFDVAYPRVMEWREISNETSRSGRLVAKRWPTLCLRVSLIRAKVLPFGEVVPNPPGILSISRKPAANVMMQFRRNHGEVRFEFTLSVIAERSVGGTQEEGNEKNSQERVGDIVHLIAIMQVKHTNPNSPLGCDHEVKSGAYLRRLEPVGSELKDFGADSRVRDLTGKERRTQLYRSRISTCFINSQLYPTCSALCRRSGQSL
jgi:hypothetical protein